MTHAYRELEKFTFRVRWQHWQAASCDVCGSTLYDHNFAIFHSTNSEDAEHDRTRMCTPCFEKIQRLPAPPKPCAAYLRPEQRAELVHIRSAEKWLDEEHSANLADRGLVKLWKETAKITRAGYRALRGLPRRLPEPRDR